VWIDRFVTTRVTQAVELAARFAEARHNVLAANVANIDTPDYQARTLDAKRFQKALAAALDRAKSGRKGRLPALRDRQFATAPDGKISVRPDVEPAQNVLFHDGTNARLETLMSDAQKNELAYELSMNLLRGRYQGLMTAIRGRVQ